MGKFNLKSLSILELLQCFSGILNELKQRGVVRTRNNPTGDYAEWLVATKFKLKLELNSNAGYDAASSRGKKVRFQIKGRRAKKSRQLSVIRNLDAKKFDYLMAVLFDDDFTVREAYKMPYKIVKKYAEFNEHQNGHILHLRGDILKDKKVGDITQVLKRTDIPEA